jgi:saccharopine dehydrogenase (NAD+, L-lysine-forming)
MLKIGVIKEGKTPPDKRVPLTPKKCLEVIQLFGDKVELVVQPSAIRCFRDEEYTALGVPLQQDVSDCDVLIGVKEVPIEQLIPEKTYFFFSHTIKKQPHNRKLLQAILQKNITLVDYETLTNAKGERIIAFGRWAGIVGAYNGFLTYGKKHKLFDLKPAHQCVDLEDMQEEFFKVKLLPPIKIAVTGGGRVANGAVEIIDMMGIKQVSVEEFLIQTFQEPVYARLHSADYHERKDGGPWDTQHFFTRPEAYQSIFRKFTQVTDLLIAAAYWNPAAPVLFTTEETASHDFRINTIADITCDIDGSVPCTKRSTTIEDPAFDFNPQTGMLEQAYSRPENITVMAIDNLPCELPRNASRDFGRQFIDNVLPHLLNEDPEEVIARATIAKKGQLTGRYSYLSDYVAENALVKA